MEEQFVKSTKKPFNRLGVVAPYEELAEVTRQVCKDLGLAAIVAVGDLDEGIEIARELVAQGAEVIVSRGGTARAISEALDVPVVEIVVSAFDLVRTLAAAKVYGRRIGVVGFRNVIYGCRSLAEILDVKIEELEIRVADEVSTVIEEAKDSGLEVIVGDVVSVRYGLEFGLAALLVSSGKEAIGLALRQAQDQAEIRRRERARVEQLKMILDFTYEGIITTDQWGRISLVNRAAERTLCTEEATILGRLISDIFPGQAIGQVLEIGSTRVGELHRVGNTLVVQNVVPVVTDGDIIGVVATFQDAGHLQDIEVKVRQELHLRGHVAHFTFVDIATHNGAMRRLLVEAEEFAGAEAKILITGETGTGKEMLAQSIHNASQRINGPFVAINCAAVPENLLESELFGYEEGAFTGARKGGKKGLFELAHRGTLFLDEIGELSLNLQARLLRVLQENAIMRVGGDRLVPVDARVIAATHCNLEKAVAEGAFRQDLYFRINVLRLYLPPLRQRQEDIVLLVRLLVDKICRRTSRLAPIIRKEIMNLFESYAWPGNIRELENILERLVVLRGGREVELADVEGLVDMGRQLPEGESQAHYLEMRGTLEEMERKIILRTLENNRQDKEKTWRELGISKTTLWRRLKG